MGLPCLSECEHAVVQAVMAISIEGMILLTDMGLARRGGYFLRMNTLMGVPLKFQFSRIRFSRNRR